MNRHHLERILVGLIVVTIIILAVKSTQVAFS